MSSGVDGDKGVWRMEVAVVRERRPARAERVGVECIFLDAFEF